jgi:hypothetical protein
MAGDSPALAMLAMETMMNWQDIAALSIAAFCAVYVGRQAWRSLAGKKSGCGCDKPCSGGDAQLLSIGPPPGDSPRPNDAGKR